MGEGGALDVLVPDSCGEGDFLGESGMDSELGVEAEGLSADGGFSASGVAWAVLSVWKRCSNAVNWVVIFSRTAVVSSSFFAKLACCWSARWSCSSKWRTFGLEEIK